MRGRSMVERVERQESTGRDTIYMSNMNTNLNHHKYQMRTAQVNHHSAVSEMNKTENKNPTIK